MVPPVFRMAIRRLPVGCRSPPQPRRTLWRPSRSSDNTCAITKP